MRDLDQLMDDLAGEATPVRPLSSRAGRLELATIAAGTLAAIYALFGFRPDVRALAPSLPVALSAGLMVLLAAAAGMGAIRMARPQVGAPSSGASWVLAAILILPAIAAIRMVADPAEIAGLDAHSGLRCLTVGMVAALGALAFLLVWLRRGAPVSPGPAAWLAGLSAGAVGALAVTLECPDEDFAHLAVWHVAVIVAVGGASSLLLPRFLRW